MLQSDKIYSYKAHQMGTNGVDAIVINESSENSNVLITSCGDDQALSFCQMTATFKAGSFRLEPSFINNVVQNEKLASSSALKAIKIKSKRRKDKFLYRLFVTGYNQNLAVWEYDYLNHKNMSLTRNAESQKWINLLKEIPLEISDVSSIDCLSLKVSEK